MNTIRFPRASRFALAASLVALAVLPAGARTIRTASPDGKVALLLSDDGGRLRYRVTMDGKPMLAASDLGVRADGIAFGEDASLGAVSPGTVDHRYPFLGGRAQAVDKARIATVAARSGGHPFQVDLHVADDGVGIRVRLPARPGQHVEADLSTWRLAAADAPLWSARMTNQYENAYETTRLSTLGTERQSFPLTARVAGRWLTISEAALVDYGDLAFRRAADGALAGELYADPKGWTTDAEVVQPWRVTILARDLDGLVHSTLVQNLNPPPDAALAQADWIRPGRSSWQWLAAGKPIEGDQHRWVDWTRQLGYEYYLIDDGWSGWKDAWGTLADTVDYARGKGVRIWVWLHSKHVTTSAQREPLFARLAALGVAGVKVDFPPDTDRWWANWYGDLARDAAAHRLMVDFHGATKPTGTERTWPNVLTREGVRGHEWQITRYKRVLPAAHDTILPFTRYVVGPGDYTPTVFEPKELQGNSWAHELAQAILFTSPFLSMGGHPQTYLDNPARDVLTAIPATWDETRVLAGSEPGKVAAMARRSGDRWFVGIINGGAATALDIPLAFLGGGRWQATELRDVADKPAAWDRRDGRATGRDRLRLTLAPRGGFVGWFRR